jgi:hypothetical protein
MNKLKSEYMNKFVKSSFLAMPFLLFGLSSFSQDNDKDNKDKTFNESFDFVQTYKPQISDAIKLNISPVIEKIDYKKDSISYKTDPKPLQLDLKSTAKIGTVSLMKNKSKDSREELERLFIKAGIGNYSNLFAQVDYNTTKMENSMLAVHFQHQSGNSAPANSNFGEQNLYIAGRKYFKNTLLSSKLYLDNNKLHFYGYPDTFPENKKNIATQNFFDIGLNAQLNNEIDTNSKLKYWFDLIYDNFSDAFKAGETGLDLNGTIEQKINNYPIRFTLGYLFKNYQLDNVVNKDYILHVGANYLITKSNWRTELGFFVDYDSKPGNIHFYPNVYAQANLYNNSLIMFAGITGNVISNSFKSLALENPYLLDSLDIRNTNNKFEIYGGLKGNFGKDFNYIVKVSYQNLEYLSMFVNDSANLNRFNIVYDSMTTLLKLHAELNKFITDKLEVFLAFNYYNYSMSNEAYPWHKPVYDLKLSAKYHLEKKIYVNLDLLNIGERKAKNFIKPSEPYILKPIYDANVGITYQFNKMIGIYFQFNNILSTKYSYWNNYELRGFQVVGGLKVNL